MWPCAGNGNTSMCAPPLLLPPELDMREREVLSAVGSEFVERRTVKSSMLVYK